MNHMYIMSIFSFFLKKILLFHLGSEILSLVVHWGMKVMDMTKKLTIRKLHWQKSQKVSSIDLALVCFQCFQNLFINYKKLKQFARKRTITKNNCWNNNKIMKKIVKCIMYEKNWNWWTSPCVSEQRSSAASLTLKLKKVWNRWLTTQQLERVYCVFCGWDQWNSGQLCMLGLTRWKLMSAIMSSLKDFWNLDYDNMTFENCILFM